MTIESRVLKLSEGQWQTLRRYADCPPYLAERLTAMRGEKAVEFTLDELDDLLDEVEIASYRAKGNEKQKVLRIFDKIAALLGSRINLATLPVRRSETTTDTIFQIKMSLHLIYPRIWRRIQVRDCTLEQLHVLIQAAMGWEFGHGYVFRIDGVEYANLDVLNDSDVEDACRTSLSDVIPVQNRRPRFYYEYDFGDEWMHQLIVEERFLPEEGVRYPRCVGGERACPPEDCGGPWIFSDFVEAIRNTEHPDHQERLEQVGGDFDPERFDVRAVNRELAKVQ